MPRLDSSSGSGWWPNAAAAICCSSPARPPAVRIDGRVLRLDAGPLDGDDIEEAVLPVLLPHAKEQYPAGRYRRRLVPHPGPRALSHQPAPRARPSGRRRAHAARTRPSPRQPRAPARRRTDCVAPARARDTRRRDRIGQDDDAGRDRRRDQSPRRRGTSSRSRTRSSTSTSTRRASSSRSRSASMRLISRRRCAPRSVRRRT